MSVFVELTEFLDLKTADLSGAALDWAVAKAEGLDCGLWKKGSAPGYSVIIVSTFFCPSNNWADCGPLVSRYLMDFSCDHPETIGAALCDENGMYLDEHMAYGRTHLIAACRAIVAHKLGDTVSVPKELLP